MTKNISEEELIELLASNNKEGLSLLYDNYAAAIYGVVIRIVNTEDAAQDVLQETFIKVWKNFSNYDKKKGRLFTWILNIARNRAIDYTRSTAYKFVRMHESIEENAQGEMVEEGQDHSDLTGAVNSLRPDVKKLFDLVYYQGYSQADAANYLNIPLGTVKTRIRSGLMELRKTIR